MADRILQGAPATISRQFSQDGVAADPGATTYSVLRDSDSSVVTSGSASGATTAPRTFNLTGANTALLDLLKVTWTTANLGTATSWIEVVGGFVYSLADALAQFPSLSAATLEAARTKAEQDLERELNYALVPRYTREVLTPNGVKPLRTTWPLPRALRSAKINGIALTSGQLATVVLRRGSLWYPTGWGYLPSSVEVVYEHGQDEASGGAADAALTLTKDRLAPSEFDSRVIQAAAGEESFTFVSPSGGGDAPFGIPSVDRFVRSNRLLMVG